MSHNPIGRHGLLQGKLYLFLRLEDCVLNLQGNYE
jgi:hypothetical protein